VLVVLRWLLILSDELSDALWSVSKRPKKKASPEDRQIEALSKALKNTRPDHAGAPWEGEEDERRSEYWHLPEGE
jgi:hypothetical protein